MIERTPMKTKPLIGITTSFDSKASTMNIRTTYTEAVMHGGGIPVLLPVTMDPERIRELFESVDGVLLCGGPDIHPNLYGEQIKYYCGHVNHERDVFELELARLCIEEDKPLMGICRGSQVLNVACGGTLYQDINLQGATDFKHADNSESHSPVAHPVNLLTGKFFEQVLGISELEITSWHIRRCGRPAKASRSPRCAPTASSKAYTCRLKSASSAWNGIRRCCRTTRDTSCSIILSISADSTLR